MSRTSARPTALGLSSAPRTLRWGTPAAAALGAALLALSACTSGPTSTRTALGAAPSSAAAGPAAPAGATGHAHLGAITVSGAYMPAPASPDVATAYFTVTDSSATADTLTSVTCTAAGSVTLHKDVTAGSGADRMVPLKGGLPVPAHGEVALSPAHGLHVMVEQPKRQWRPGDHVVLVLHFAHAGSVRLIVPVLSALAVAGGGANTAATTGPTAGMSGMPGM